MKLFKRHNNVLPGFGLTLGFTIFYLSVIVLIPLSALVFRTACLTWHPTGSRSERLSSRR